MRTLLTTLLVMAAVVAGGCGPAAVSDGAVAGKDQEIAQLKAQLKQREDEINGLKKSLSMAPPSPNQNTVAVGRGDGRFVVIPSKVRPGLPIGIFSDLGGGQLRLIRVSDNKEMAQMAGPKPSQILVYTIPTDLAPGTYRISFLGNGGTSGEADIQVEGN